MTWYDLSNSNVDGCGDGQTRTQKGNGADADWIFNVPSNKSCVFQLYIPDDSAITSKTIDYQLFTSTSNHADANRLSQHYMDQTDERGEWIAFNSAPIASPTGVFDLQLHDDQDKGTIVVADAAKAICS